VPVPAGGGFEALRGAIASRHGAFPPVLRRIAEFALDHPNEMALDTVTALARRAGVQPSALVRFAQSLGFTGFTELQRVFRDRLTENQLSYRERLRRRRGPLADRHGDPAAVLRDFVAASVHALEHLEADIDPGRLEQAVEVLARADAVHVVAQRRSFPVAAYLAYALAKLDRGTVLLDGLGGMLAEQARVLSPGGALLAVSFKPYAPETLGVVEVARERGVPVVALTDRPLSPLQGLADVSLEVDEAEVLDFRLLTATMCLTQALVVSLGRRLLLAEGSDAATAAAAVEA
jgi:DNA-binding MurR/RpiR family transcriptional regulator